MALAGKGHDVTLSFLPYTNWDKPIQKFDLRKQNLYTREVLSKVHPLMQIQSLLDVRPFSRELPADLRQAVEAVSVFDTQYTLQVEDITGEEEVYKIRQERNLEAARTPGPGYWRTSRMLWSFPMGPSSKWARFIRSRNIWISRWSPLNSATSVNEFGLHRTQRSCITRRMRSGRLWVINR